MQEELPSRIRHINHKVADWNKQEWDYHELWNFNDIPCDEILHSVVHFWILLFEKDVSLEREC